MDKVLQYVEELYGRSSLTLHGMDGLGYNDLSAYPPEAFLEESAGLFAHLSTVVKKEFKVIGHRGRVLEYCYFFLCFAVKSGLMARIDQYNDLGNLRVIDENDYDPNNYAFFRTYVTALEKGFTFKTKQQSWMKRDVSEAVVLFEACGNLLPLVKFGGEGYLEEILPMMEKYNALGHFRFVLEFGATPERTLPPLTEEQDEYSPEEMVSVNRLPAMFQLEDSSRFMALSTLEQSLLLGYHIPWTGTLPLCYCRLNAVSWREVALPFKQRALGLLGLLKNAEDTEEKVENLKEYQEICEKISLLTKYEQEGGFPTAVLAEEDAEREKQRLTGVSLKDVTATSGVVRENQLSYRKLEGSTGTLSISHSLLSDLSEMSEAIEHVKNHNQYIRNRSLTWRSNLVTLSEEKAKVDEVMKDSCVLQETLEKYTVFSKGFDNFVKMKDQ